MVKILKIFWTFDGSKPYIPRNPKHSELWSTGVPVTWCFPVSHFSSEVSFSVQGTTSDICQIRHRLRRKENATLKSLSFCKIFLV